MKTLLFSSALFCCLNFSNAQTGSLDPTFGSNGIVSTDMGSGFNYSNFGNQVFLQADGSMYLVFEAAGVTVVVKKLEDGLTDLTYGNKGLSVSVPISGPHAAMQTDGKIVVVGYVLNSDHYSNITDFAVARYNTDGSLDNTFSEDGIQTTDFKHEDIANSLAIQTDGKIVVAGYTDEYFDNQIYMVMARYNADGSLDNTFNDDGMLEAINEYSNSVAVQSNGKIVIGNGNALSRYTSNGTRDNTFMEGDFGSFSQGPGSLVIQSNGKFLLATGSRLTRFNSSGSLDKIFDEAFEAGQSIITSIAIQVDGKILQAGYAVDGSNKNFAIARYNTDGTLDNSFSDDGKQITDFDSPADNANAIAIRGDGKLVALGYTMNGINTYVALARYNTDGTPDNSFDSDGKLIDHIIQGSTYYTSTAIQNDGKVVAAGYTWNGDNYDFAIARYNTDGSLDNTFSGDGKQMTDLNSSDDKARAVVIQNDGKIVLAGSAGDDFGLTRYNTDGSLDISFDGDGMQTTDFGSSDAVNSVSIQNDGKILAGGSALARYNTNGSLDVSFDEDGKVTRPFTHLHANYPFNCNDISIQNDGKIIVVGAVADINSMCIVARYNINGSTDSTFGDSADGTYGAKIIIQYGDPLYQEDFSFHGKSIAIQNDGKIVVGGDYENKYRLTISYFILARLNTDGSLDNMFGGDGIVFLNYSNSDYGTSVIIQSDNKIILGGYSYNGSSDDFLITRYNTDGSLDNTFNDDGIVITGASGAYDRIAGIAIADNKLYAAGYGQYPGNFGVVARYFLTAGPVPVTLADFTAILQRKSVLLQWQTATENNLSRFIIERSGDGNNFSPINSITATGNSLSKISYSTIDRLPLQGVNFYRLKTLDADGKFTYSKIVVVIINDESLTLQVFPNPVKNVLFVRAGGENEKAAFQIFDAGARKLKEVNVTLNGNTSFYININSLPKGIYNLRLHTKTKIVNRAFIKE